MMMVMVVMMVAMLFLSFVDDGDDNVVVGNDAGHGECAEDSVGREQVHNNVVMAVFMMIMMVMDGNGDGDPDDVDDDASRWQALGALSRLNLRFASQKNDPSGFDVTGGATGLGHVTKWTLMIRFGSLSTRVTKGDCRGVVP